MGYIPAPPRGVLVVQAATPTPKDGIAWWNTTDGGLRRFSNAAGEWMPVGEPTAIPTGLGLGEPAEVIAGSVAIGEGAKVTGDPT